MSMTSNFDQIVDQIKNNSLDMLILNENNIDKCQQLFELMKTNTSAQIVSLTCYNPNTYQYCKLLAELLKINETITNVFFELNVLDEGFTCIMDALKINNTVISLKISASTLSNNSCCELANLLKVNNKISVICLNIYRLNIEGFKTISDALEYNRSVISIYGLCSVSYLDNGSYYNSIINNINNMTSRNGHNIRMRSAMLCDL
jgi:hypothetical protein